MSWPRGGNFRGLHDKETVACYTNQELFIGHYESDVLFFVNIIYMTIETIQSLVDDGELDAATETNQPLWEQYEGYEDELFVAKGGGGGKAKTRDPNSKTSQAARDEHRQKGRENRRDEARGRVMGVLRNFPEFGTAQEEDAFIQRYVEWVNQALHSKDISSTLTGGLEFEFMRSGKKAGGQNVNKVNSAVRCTHKATNITVRNEETRDQVKNKAQATELVRSALQAHIEDWKIALEPDGKLDPDLVLEMAAETL